MKKLFYTVILAFIGVNQVWGQELSLDSAKSRALRNNMQMKNALLQIEMAEQVKKNAFTHYFPKVEAGAVAFKTADPLFQAQTPELNLPVYDGNPVNIPNASQFAYVPGMNIGVVDYMNTGYIAAVQPLFTGGRIINGNKLAELGTSIQKDQLQLTTEQVIVQTESLYWTLVALNEKKNTLKRYDELLENLQKDAEVSYISGLITRSDLLKIELEINKVVANKIQLENGIKLVQMSLCQHIGQPYVENLTLTDTSLLIDSPDIIFLETKRALEDRAEYKMLNKAVSAEELQKKMVTAEYLPSVAVGASAYYLDVMETESSNGMFFATLSIPISDWWGGSYKKQEHKIKIEMAQNNLKEKSELLQLQMNKTYNDLNEAYHMIQVSESTKSQSEQYFNEVQNNYNAGISSTSDWLEAHAILEESRGGLIEAKVNYKIKLSLYLQSTGRLN
jgi:outer membrane protein TolC